MWEFGNDKARSGFYFWIRPFLRINTYEITIPLDQKLNFKNDSCTLWALEALLHLDRRKICAYIVGEEAVKEIHIKHAVRCVCVPE